MSAILTTEPPPSAADTPPKAADATASAADTPPKAADATASAADTPPSAADTPPSTPDGESSAAPRGKTRRALRRAADAVVEGAADAAAGAAAGAAVGVARLLPAARTGIQVSGLVVIAIALVTSMLTREFQNSTMMVIVGTIPLIISVGHMDRQPAKRQFQLLVMAGLMTLVFLAVAVVQIISIGHAATADRLAAADRFTTEQQTTGDFFYAKRYADQVAESHQALERQFAAEPIRRLLNGEPGYPRYRAMLLEQFAGDTDLEGFHRLERVISFYESAIGCAQAGRCSWTHLEQNYRSRIQDLWYSFRPKIEEMRVGASGPNLGLVLQRQAETWQPPHTRSAVVLDPVTRTTRLAADTPARAGN